MILRTEEEKQRARASGRALGRVIEGVCRAVRPGVSSQALEDLARELIQEAGAVPAFLGYQPAGEQRPYPAALCLSVNDMVVHGIPNERPFEIENGDVVSVDCGLVLDGIVTDATKTVIAGTPRPEDQMLVQAAEEALTAAVAAARAGNHVGDIGAAIEAVAKRYGLGVPREVGGHGVGIRVHEDPFIANWGTPGAGALLEDGMMVAIEPIFTAGSARLDWDDVNGYECHTHDGSRATEVEHTVIIGSEGGEIVTLP
ncbi:MAG TPA: type I methionyl aminopeptidase [Candidatus Paceibacterota bacterium]|nr:type I methionyl aminopeptidase [Candidatus Paceibacterota bacterium]